ncbi:hypothetical protein CFC21_095866 [Triticum aestivum]|uniref:Polycomb group protein FIE1 n=3 Tax=Triticum aestivum TaxID=4565 RepID=A0A9R1LQZ4_WHEAT|nr:hypothetical protein CFC21_095866 [Triticum aestivum]
MSTPNDETPLMGSTGNATTTPEVDTRRRSQRRPIPPAQATAAAATKAPAERKGGGKGKGKAAVEEEEAPEPQPLPAPMASLRPVQGLGCDAAVGSLVPSGSREFKLCSKHTEGKHPLYAISFNFIDARYYDIFATAGGNRVTTYRGLPDGNLAVLQAYIDADDAQSFYTVSWVSDLRSTPLLVAAGTNMVIRVINCATGKLFKSFIGHGGSINEIRTQPLNPSLFISASKDESVRLWNVHTGICILIFAGGGGHRHDVLSVDFHPSDVHRIASCGMDNTVKIWSMKEFSPYVKKSFTWTDLPSKFPTKVVQFPLMTCVVHSNYVDCTRWLGDFILSKSVENEIVLWEPKTKEQGHGEDSIDVLQKYPVPDCDIWCIKFSCDFHFNQLAIGNREGKIYVWDVQTCPPELITMLSSPQCKMTIRQTAVSFDGSTIVACSKDGSIYRWDEVEHEAAKN